MEINYNTHYRVKVGKTFRKCIIDEDKMPSLSPLSSIIHVKFIADDSTHQTRISYIKNIKKNHQQDRPPRTETPKRACSPHYKKLKPK